MDDLRGRRVLVTGASTGIGAAVARHLGGRGCRLALFARRPADHCHGDQPATRSGVHRLRHGAGFGAQRQAIAGILDIGAGHHRAVRKGQSCTDVEVRIGRIGLRRCIARSRCLLSLSQKLYVPSPPAVTKVPCCG